MIYCENHARQRVRLCSQPLVSCILTVIQFFPLDPASVSPVFFLHGFMLSTKFYFHVSVRNYEAVCEDVTFRFSPCRVKHAKIFFHSQDPAPKVEKNENEII